MYTVNRRPAWAGIIKTSGHQGGQRLILYVVRIAVQFHNFAVANDYGMSTVAKTPPPATRFKGTRGDSWARDYRFPDD